jgi:hypothetical protein
MMIDIVNSSEIPSVCYDFHFDENRAEVQWNPTIMSRNVNGGQRESAANSDVH